MFGYLWTQKKQVLKVIFIEANKEENISVNDQALEIIGEFTFLRVVITDKFENSREVKKSIAIAKKMQQHHYKNLER